MVVMVVVKFARSGRRNGLASVEVLSCLSIVYICLGGPSALWVRLGSSPVLAVAGM